MHKHILPRALARAHLLLPHRLGRLNDLRRELFRRLEQRRLARVQRARLDKVCRGRGRAEGVRGGECRGGRSFEAAEAREGRHPNFGEDKGGGRGHGFSERTAAVHRAGPVVHHRGI
jgi:hypothetical protein